MKSLTIIATLLLASAAAAAEHDHANCPMHAAHHKEEVDQRGDGVMGFSHEKTKHAFKSYEDGGAIEVRALDADAASVALIRKHLSAIAKDFAAGDFAKPKAIHATTPDGAMVMAARKALIDYQYSDIENGGRVRITTTDPAALAAVHDFLKFQIDEHGE